jgi:phosphoribosylglycinamide formyltransferase-1
MNQVLHARVVREAVHSAVVDWESSAVEKARSHGLPAVVIAEPTNEEFCDKLLEYVLENRIDYIISFYTRFYSQRIRAALPDRIINFHPSLLPAFKGMDGFGSGLAYHTKIIGTTVELVKEVMDEGKIVMQSACASDPQLDAAQMRHRIFLQQCRTLVQVVDWIRQDRLEVRGDLVTIRGANYRDLEYVPALEHEDAIRIGTT